MEEGGGRKKGWHTRNSVLVWNRGKCSAFLNPFIKDVTINILDRKWKKKYFLFYDFFNSTDGKTVAPLGPNFGWVYLQTSTFFWKCTYLKIDIFY